MLLSQVIGPAVLAALLFFLARQHSHMWRLAAARYAGKPRSVPIARKVPETIVIAHRSVRVPLLASRVYAAAALGLHDDGLSLSLIWPFSIMCPPLMIRWEAVDVEPTEWALWPAPYAIHLRGPEHVDIILAGDTVRWITEHIQSSPFEPTD